MTGAGGAAIEKGYFTEQIVPVELKTRREVKSFTTDEHPRGDTSLETLSGLRAAFAKDGAVTAGNSSGINDGAAALILSDEASAKSGDRAPLAKIIAYGFGGVPARIMGMGPVPASQMALDRAGLRVSDIAIDLRKPSICYNQQMNKFFTIYHSALGAKLMASADISSKLCLDTNPASFQYMTSSCPSKFSTSALELSTQSPEFA